MQNKLLNLPKFLIIKVVLFLEETTNDFLFVTNNTKINEKLLSKKSILSFHPLIIKVDNAIYHVKQLQENDFYLINFCLNNVDDYQYNNIILENYFQHQSNEI